MNKKCFKCGEVKSLNQYYPHKQMADGYLNKCKDCAKKDSMNHRWNNIEKVREYDRKRGKFPHRKKLFDDMKARYIIQFPMRVKAVRAVSNAIRDKKLKRATNCSICNKEGKLEGHHDDYNKPLDVRWLCLSCHRKLHREISINKEATNGTIR